MNIKKYTISIYCIILMIFGCTRFYTKKFIIYDMNLKTIDDWIVDSNVYFADNFPSGHYSLSEPDSLFRILLSFTHPKLNTSNSIFKKSTFKFLSSDIIFTETKLKKNVTLNDSWGLIDSDKNRILTYYFGDISIPSNVQQLQLRFVFLVNYQEDKLSKRKELIINMRRYENVKWGVWIPSR